MLLGGQRQRVHRSERLEEGVPALGGQAGEARLDGMRELMVLGVPVRRDRRLDACGELEGTIPSVGAFSEATGLPEAVVGDGNDVPEGPLCVDPRKGPQDGQQRELRGVLRIVPPDGGNEVRDERRPEPRQQRVQRPWLPTLRLTHEVSQLLLIRPDFPRASHGGSRVLSA